MLIYALIRGDSDFYMIELITTSFFVFSSIYGGPVSAGVSDIASSAPMVTTPQIEQTLDTNIPTNKGIEAKAKAYFKDMPVLADIAFCESSFRQYDANGNILKGKVNKGDLGVMQINKYYHAEKAEELGLDLETTEGNMAYAKYLYSKQGTKPWASSSKCWNKSAPTDQIAMK